MSTEYAVAMSLPEFIVLADDLGWRLERSPVPGECDRFRLVDGSPSGFAYDPRQVEGNDGQTWTMFTRYGASSARGLASAMGAIEEGSDAFDDISGNHIDRSYYLLDQAVTGLFEDFPVDADEVRDLLEAVICHAQEMRDLQRPWAIGGEREPLPTINGAPGTPAQG